MKPNTDAWLFHDTLYAVDPVEAERARTEAREPRVIARQIADVIAEMARRHRSKTLAGWAKRAADFANAIEREIRTRRCPLCRPETGP